MEENYHPSGRGPQLIAVFAFFAVLSTLMIGLRVYVRACVIKAFGSDDWTILLGWIIFVFHAGFAIAGGYHGTGQHANLIQPPQNIPIALKYWWICEPLYVISNMAVKLSIGLMLLRILLERLHRTLIYTSLSILELYSVAYFFLFVFQCYPPSWFWERFQGVSDGKCMATAVIINATYAYSAITIVIDITFALLPWVMVRSLTMNRRTKLLVAIVLGLASIASIATIVRTPYISRLGDTADFLYSTTDVAIWSCTETGLSITASCAATLKPLFRTFLERSNLFGHTSQPRDSEAWPRGVKLAYIQSSSVEDTMDMEGGRTSSTVKSMQTDVRPLADPS